MGKQIHLHAIRAAKLLELLKARLHGAFHSIPGELGYVGDGDRLKCLQGKAHTNISCLYIYMYSSSTVGSTKYKCTAKHSFVFLSVTSYNYIITYAHVQKAILLHFWGRMYKLWVL